MVLLPPLKMTPAGRHYTLSNVSLCWALEVPFQTAVEKDPHHDKLHSDKGSEEVVKNIFNVRALLNFLRQGIPDTCSTRKRAARDILFELLAYGTLLERNSVMRGKSYLSGRKVNCCCTETFVDKMLQVSMNKRSRDAGCVWIRGDFKWTKLTLRRCNPWFTARRASKSSIELFTGRRERSGDYTVPWLDLFENVLSVRASMRFFGTFFLVLKMMGLANLWARWFCGLGVWMLGLGLL